MKIHKSKEAIKPFSFPLNGGCIDGKSVLHEFLCDAKKNKEIEQASVQLTVFVKKERDVLVPDPIFSYSVPLYSLV